MSAPNPCCALVCSAAQEQQHSLDSAFFVHGRKWWFEQTAPTRPTHLTTRCVLLGVVGNQEHQDKTLMRNPCSLCILRPRPGLAPAQHWGAAPNLLRTQLNNESVGL